MLKSCYGCDFNDPDLGCSCPVDEMWYVCPLEPEPTENDFERVADSEV